MNTNSPLETKYNYNDFIVEAKYESIPGKHKAVIFSFWKQGDKKSKFIQILAPSGNRAASDKFVFETLLEDGKKEVQSILDHSYEENTKYESQFTDLKRK